MGKKIGYIFATWFFVIFVYVILANASPAITALTSESAATMQSTSNMTNYPGALEFVQSFPLMMWFIPGGVGMVATFVFLKMRPTAG